MTVKFTPKAGGDPIRKSITANFEVFNYKATVAVSDNAGTSAVSQSGNVYYNDRVNIRANPDSHHVFDHWERDGSTVGENDARYDLTAADSGKTITAVFADAYEVKAINGDNGIVTPKVQGVKPGESHTLTGIPYAGYEVDEWKEGGNTLQTGGNKLTLASVTADREITVTFKKIEYPVTARVRGAGGTVSPTSTTVEHGGSITLTASPATGYEVERWEHPGGTQEGGNTLTISDVTDEQEITVIFKKIQCQIFATVSNAGGTVSPTSESVAHGDSLTLTASPEKGYLVDEWTEGGVTLQTGGNTLKLNDIKKARDISVSFRIPSKPQVTDIAVRESAKEPEEGMPVPCEIWVAVEGEGLENVALTRVWQEDGEEKSEIFDIYDLQGQVEAVRFFTVYQPGEYFATVRDVHGVDRASEHILIDIVEGSLQAMPKTPDGD